MYYTLICDVVCGVTPVNDPVIFIIVSDVNGLKKDVLRFEFDLLVCVKKT